ncbi:MAG: sugar ABC transporter permease [Deltaproteobacteria bacterium]|nr:MAG: sugar ABC transporter permease [Deltaproteobacteria bacterium]
MNRMSYRSTLAAYLFLSPWVIGLLIFVGGPIVAIFILSLTKWDLLGSPTWIGLRNYINMFQGKGDFWLVFANTLIYTVIGVLVSVVWALFTALLLNQKVPGTGLAGALFFAPAVVPYIATAFALQLILRGDLGILNYWLRVIGVRNPPSWLMDPQVIIWVLPALTIYTFYTGQMMLIFDAALKEVPKELYEIAQLDGASSLTIFTKVTLPMMSPILLFNVIVSFINTLNMSFTVIYPLTAGGPGKTSTVLSVDLYENAFKGFRIGYACAEAVVLFVLCVLGTACIFWLSRRRVYYEA